MTVRKDIKSVLSAEEGNDYVDLLFHESASLKEGDRIRITFASIAIAVKTTEGTMTIDDLIAIQKGELPDFSD